MAIRVNLDVMLAKRKMSVNELAEAIGITPVNVSDVRTGWAKAYGFPRLIPYARRYVVNREMCSNGLPTKMNNVLR